MDATDRDNRFGLSQSDFYQMFAYGQKYLDGKGDLALIYPMTRRFPSPSGPFEFSGSMRLWILPFDLDVRKIHIPYVGTAMAPAFSMVISRARTTAHRLRICRLSRRDGR